MSCPRSREPSALPLNAFTCTHAHTHAAQNSANLATTEISMAPDIDFVAAKWIALKLHERRQPREHGLSVVLVGIGERATPPPFGDSERSFFCQVL